MADKVRVAVLISGRGSNMLALSEHKRRDPDRPYDIALRDVIRSIEHGKGPSQSGDEEQRAKNADARQRVRTAMEDLRHGWYRGALH